MMIEAYCRDIYIEIEKNKNLEKKDLDYSILDRQLNKIFEESIPTLKKLISNYIQRNKLSSNKKFEVDIANILDYLDNNYLFAVMFGRIIKAISYKDSDVEKIRRTEFVCDMGADLVKRYNLNQFRFFNSQAEQQLNFSDWYNQEGSNRKDDKNSELIGYLGSILLEFMRQCDLLD